MSKYEQRQTRSAELARLLAQPDGLRLVRLLQAGGFLTAQPGSDAPEILATSTADDHTAPRPISIWEPVESETGWCFVRPEASPLGDHYAARRQFSLTKPDGVRRICFFGESVAAGYLYAPHLTPAEVLQGQLDEVYGPNRWEVIDLARTNETLATLVATVEAAGQLQPDGLVIFAGNNWNLLETTRVSPYVPDVDARQKFARALAEKGLEGVMELGVLHLVDKARRALDRVAALGEAFASWVLLILPEVNQADWESRQPVTRLAGDGNAAWYRLYRRAQDELAVQNGAQALKTGMAMLELDGGTCPTSYRVLARAWMAMGKWDQVAEACRAEIDSGHYATLCFLDAPRASTLVRQVQMDAARKHGFGVVDCRFIFAEFTGSPLPDRRIFLDYCHLTVLGMKLTMAGVTAKLSERFADTGSGTGRNWRELATDLPDPVLAPEQDALAKFGAAIHSAHRLLPLAEMAPIIEYWCEQALLAAPAIESTMLDYVEARAAPCPAVLSAAQQRNAASRFPLSQQHGWRYDYLDAEVIQAIASVLERRTKGSSQRIARLLLQHRGLTKSGQDLVCPPFYLWRPLERLFPEVMSFDDLTGRATFRAVWPETHFALICDGRTPVILELTARLGEPVASAGPTLEPRSGALSINGEQVATWPLFPRWTKFTVRIEPNSLVAGLNRLTLHWPDLADLGEAPMTETIARLELGLEADLHPLFGELFSLSARLE